MRPELRTGVEDFARSEGLLARRLGSSGLLDGLNLIRYQDDAQLLAAWESARTVVGSGRVNGTGNGAAPVDAAPSAAPEASPPVM